jgi:molybdopterin molybdotransferase
MGCVGETPVFLLPGDPLAAFCAYDLFAGRAIRKMGGRDPQLPYPVREARVRRKIVSEVGQFEICRVRVAGDGVEPLGTAESGGLASVARADGFVCVPAALEGFPDGACVSVYFYAPAVASSFRCAEASE